MSLHEIVEKAKSDTIELHLKKLLEAVQTRPYDKKWLISIPTEERADFRKAIETRYSDVEYREEDASGMFGGSGERRCGFRLKE